LHYEVINLLSTIFVTADFFDGRFGERNTAGIECGSFQEQTRISQLRIEMLLTSSHYFLFDFPIFKNANPTSREILFLP